MTDRTKAGRTQELEALSEALRKACAYAEADPAGWPDKQATADLLGRTTRTVDNMVKDGRLEKLNTATGPECYDPRRIVWVLLEMMRRKARQRGRRSTTDQTMPIVELAIEACGGVAELARQLVEHQKKLFRDEEETKRIIHKWKRGDHAISCDFEQAIIKIILAKKRHAM